MEMGPSAGACGPERASSEPRRGESGEPAAVLVTLELDEQGKETRMRMTISCPTKEVRDAMIASGMEQGIDAGYAAMDRLLAELAR
jgi:hypothetical protein